MARIRVLVTERVADRVVKRAGMAERKVDSGRRFSYYYQTLEEVPKVRSNEKLAMLGGMEDPYATIASASFETSGTQSREYSSAESPQVSGRLQQNTSQDIWCFCCEAEERNEGAEALLELSRAVTCCDSSTVTQQTWDEITNLREENGHLLKENCTLNEENAAVYKEIATPKKGMTTSEALMVDNGKVKFILDFHPLKF